MNNYEYTPQELKIIMDIANKHKIPISLGEDSIKVHSKRDFTPLMKFSKNGFSIQVDFDLNNIEYRWEISKVSKIFMQEKVAFEL